MRGLVGGGFKVARVESEVSTDLQVIGGYIKEASMMDGWMFDFVLTRVLRDTVDRGIRVPHRPHPPVRDRAWHVPHCQCRPTDVQRAGGPPAACLCIDYVSMAVLVVL